MLAASPFNGMYSSHDSEKIKNGRPSLDCGENQPLFFVALYQVSHCCYSGYLTFPL